MRAFSVKEFSILKQFDTKLVQEIFKKATGSEEIKLLVKKPKNISIWAYTRDAALYESKGKSRQLKLRLPKTNGMPTSSAIDYLGIDPYSVDVVKDDQWVVAYFVDGFQCREEEVDRGVSLKGIDLKGRVILVPYRMTGKNPTNKKVGERRRVTCKVDMSDLFVAVDHDDITNIQELQEYINVFDAIPKKAIDQFRELPELNLNQFTKLRHLKEVYEEVWEDWDKEELIEKGTDIDIHNRENFEVTFSLGSVEDIEEGKATLKSDTASIIDSAENHFYNFFPGAGFDKERGKIKEDFVKKKDHAFLELLRRFFNDGLEGNQKPIKKGVHRYVLNRIMNESSSSKDGYRLGEKTASAASNWITPNIGYDSNGRIKQVENGLAPVRLWILFCSAEVLWVGSGEDEVDFYPTNEESKEFLKLITGHESLPIQEIKSDLVLEKYHVFLNRFPEIKYLQNIKITELDYEKAASLIRPDWAPSMKKRKD